MKEFRVISINNTCFNVNSLLANQEMWGQVRIEYSVGGGERA
jgi:hypothetical protein